LLGQLNKLLGEFYTLPLPLRLSRDLVSWLVHTPRNHPQRPPASDLVLPPVDHSQWATDHSTCGAQALSRGRRTGLPPTKQFLNAATRQSLWSLSARTSPSTRSAVQEARRSSSSRNRKELRLAGDPLHRRHRRSFRAARCYRTIRPRRQQYLRLPAITCDKHCSVYNRWLRRSA